jgi:hypothetical protein
MSAQYSRYVIIAPRDYEVRYKQLNFTIPPIITQKGDTKTYTWEMRNIPATPSEVMSPDNEEISARMLVAPSDFEAQGIKITCQIGETMGNLYNS